MNTINGLIIETETEREPAAERGQEDVDRVPDDGQHGHIVEEEQVRILRLVLVAVGFGDIEHQKVQTQRKHEPHREGAVGQDRPAVRELKWVHMVVPVDMDTPQSEQGAARQITEQQRPQPDAQGVVAHSESE